MKKISLKNLNYLEEQLLSKDQLKSIMGGYSEEIEPDDEIGGGTGCGDTTNDMFCSANCQTPRGAASKCAPNASKKCTCGGV